MCKLNSPLRATDASAGIAGCGACSALPVEPPLGDSVSECQAPALELRRRPVEGIVAVVHTPLAYEKLVAPGDDLVDMFRIVLPVRGDVQGAALLELAGGKLQEIGLHETSLVVAFLRPGVREVQIDSPQGTVRELLLQYFDRVVTDETQIAGVPCFGLQKAMPDAGSVYFYAQIVEFRVTCRLLDERLPVAKADLENPFGGSAENPVQVQGGGRERDAIPGPQFRESPLLGASDTPGTKDEAPHPAFRVGAGRIVHDGTTGCRPCRPVSHPPCREIAARAYSRRYAAVPNVCCMGATSVSACWNRVSRDF